MKFQPLSSPPPPSSKKFVPLPTQLLLNAFLLLLFSIRSCCYLASRVSKFAVENEKSVFGRGASHLHLTGASSAPGLQPGFPCFELSEVSPMTNQAVPRVQRNKIRSSSSTTICMQMQQPVGKLRFGSMYKITFNQYTQTDTSRRNNFDLQFEHSA